jgi:hypothetical protein
MVGGVGGMVCGVGGMGGGMVGGVGGMVWCGWDGEMVGGACGMVGGVGGGVGGMGRRNGMCLMRLCLGFMEPKFWVFKRLVFWTWQWPSGLALCIISTICSRGPRFESSKNTTPPTIPPLRDLSLDS